LLYTRGEIFILELFIILNVILGFAAAIFVVKNFLIKLIWSKKARNNIIMLVCIIAALLSAFACLRVGFPVDDRKDHLKYELTNLKDANPGNTEMDPRIKDELNFLNKKVIEIGIYTAAGYACYAVSFFTLRKVKKEIDDIKTEGKWDLNNFK
jgi:hypothetical protein